MGAWLIVLGGGFMLWPRVDRASALFLAIAGVYAILWQEPTLLGYTSEELFHVGLAQPVFLFFLSGAVFLWAYWLFQEHVEMLEETTGDLEDTLEIERTLLDILSHDLRTPLSVISTQLDLLERGDGTEGAFSRIHSALVRADRIIENSIIYSSLPPVDGNERARMDLRAIVDGVVEELEPMADHHRVGVRVEGPETVPAQLTPLFQHAVGNVIDNAIKYTPEGGQVHVRLDETEGTVELSIADDGPGMDPALVERAFERFERGTDDGEGSGLGLAIVRRLVDLHDGEMDVETGPEEGTTVRIRLPRPSQPEPPPGTSPGQPEVAPPVGGGA